MVCGSKGCAIVAGNQKVITTKEFAAMRSAENTRSDMCGIFIKWSRAG